MRNVILMIAGSLLISGCSTMGLTEQKTVKVKATGADKGLEIASFPAQLRGAYIYTDGEGSKFVCAEPFADVAASNSLNATASAINNLSGSLNKSLETSSKKSANKGIANTSNNSSSGEDSSSSSSSSSGNDGSINNEGSFGSTFGSSSQSEQSINLGLNAVTEIVALEGRTQFVLLAREMLFRTCEAAANGKLETADSPVAKQHEHIFTALTKMIDTQKAKADAKKAEADAEKTKAILKAAEKLDPKILKIFSDGSLNKTILEDYLEDYDSCMSNASDDAAKKKCKDTYNTNLKRLSGS